MSDPTKPQNDRELLIMLSEEVKRLSTSIDIFSEKIEVFEEKKLGGIERRVERIEKWQSQWAGAWKLITIALTALTLLGLIIKFK